MKIIKTIKNFSYKDLRYSYIIISFHFFLVRYINVYVFMPNIFKTLLSLPLAFLGFALILFGLYKKNINLNLRQNIGLFVFLGVFIISSILNFKYGFSDNLKSFVWTVISFFIFLMPPKDESFYEKEEMILKIQNYLIIYMLIFSSLSLLTFILQTNYFVPLSPEEYFAFGQIDGRLYGIYLNPNRTAFISFLSIIFSSGNLFKKTKVKTSILNIIVQVFYISLTNSRGAYLVFLAISFLFFLFFFYKNKNLNKIISEMLKEERSQKIKTWCTAVCSLCGALLIFSLLYFSLKYIKEVFSYVPKFFSFIFFNGNTEESNFFMNKVQTARFDYVNKNDISNSRFLIWLDAWELFKTKPIFGTSPQNIVNIAKIISPLGIIAKRSYSRMHNMYVDILLCTGVLGFINVAFFYVKSFWKTVKFYIKNEFMVKNITFVSSTLCILCFVIFTLVESILMFQFDLNAVFFWLFLGYILDFCNKKNIHAEVKKLA